MRAVDFDLRLEALSRFDCPSVSLRLNALLERTQHILWAALALAIVAHFMVTQWRGIQQEARLVKPLTTQFVKRQPRLTKPLELKKRPRPKRRAMQRKMVSVKARVDRGQRVGGFRPTEVLQGLAHPHVSVGRATSFQAAGMEPQAVAQRIEVRKEAKDVLDMCLEMVDVQALDTGRYHAVVIQDPSDKRNIRGFFRLRYAYSESMQKRDYNNQENRMLHGVATLIKAINQYTDIKASFEGRILFASAEMMKTPWVFSYVGWPFVFPDQEAAWVGKYLISGGFLLCDAVSQVVNARERVPVAITAVRDNFKKAVASQGFKYGRDWTFQILANNHPIYHCYFDFDGAVASHSDSSTLLAGKLEGIYVDTRWVLVISQKYFLHQWFDPETQQQYRLGSERAIQFGINTIIFALTQEGSITRRVMDTVR